MILYLQGLPFFRTFALPSEEGITLRGAGNAINTATTHMTQKMKNVITWLAERYGEFEQEMLDCGVCHLICKDAHYPIHFWVSEEGTIGDSQMVDYWRKKKGL